MTLKDMGNKKPNKNKNKHEWITCSSCKTRIDILDEYEQESIVTVGKTKIYQCNCGYDTVLN